MERCHRSEDSRGFTGVVQLKAEGQAGHEHTWPQVGRQTEVWCVSKCLGQKVAEDPGCPLSFPAEACPSEGTPGIRDRTRLFAARRVTPVGSALNVSRATTSPTAAVGRPEPPCTKQYPPGRAAGLPVRTAVPAVALGRWHCSLWAPPSHFPVEPDIRERGQSTQSPGGSLRVPGTAAHGPVTCPS